MTEIYLACAAANFREWDHEAEPLNLLIAFPFAAKCAERVASGEWKPARMMLDSGAWSAFNSGAVIDIDALIAESRRPIWTESVVLDVIGDHEASRINADYMREHGSNAFPVFHIGEPWETLEYYCRNWPKVGLACTALRGKLVSLKFLDQCFARAWPHLFHSFGWTDPEMLKRYPFDTADSTTWGVGCKYGNLVQFTGKQVAFRAPHRVMLKALDEEVRWYLKLQRELRSRWGAELATLRAAAADEQQARREACHGNGDT